MMRDAIVDIIGAIVVFAVPAIVLFLALGAGY